MRHATHRIRPATAALAALLAIVAAAPVAEASLSTTCRRACAARIADCVSAGGTRRVCRREIVAQCKQDGVLVCGGTARAAGGLQAPSSLTATAVSTSAIALQWVDTNSKETGYQIERSLNASSGFGLVASVGANARTFQDSGLAAATTFYYRIRATGRRGATSPYSAVVGATTFGTASTTTTTQPTTTSTSSTTSSTSSTSTSTTKPSTTSTTSSTSTSSTSTSSSTSSTTSTSKPSTTSTSSSTTSTSKPSTTSTSTSSSTTSSSSTSTSSTSSTTSTTKAPTTSTSSSTSTSTVTTTSSTTTTLGSGPGLVGFLPGIGTANGTAVVAGARTLLYAASEEFGLSIVDVTTPGAPTVLGASNEPFFGRDVVVAGSRAVVSGMTTTGAGLWILDVSDPTSPTVLGTFFTNAVMSFNGVAVNSTGSLAVVSLGSGGIWTIDISVPSNPVYRGAYNTSGIATGLTLAGTRLYVADGSGGLVILDVTNPSLPTLLGSKPLVGRLAYDVVVSGNYAYVTDATWLFLVFDVTTPSSPLLKASLNLPGPGYQLAVAGNRVAYLTTLTTTGDSLGMIDVTTPTAPVLLSTVGVGSLGSVDTLGVSLTATNAYTGAAQYGLRIFDTSLVLRGTATDPFTGDSIASANDVTAIAGRNRTTGNAELRIMMTACPSGQAWCAGAKPSKPRLVGTFATNVVTTFNDVAMNPAGTLAVVSLGSAGIWTIDLTTPNAPARLGGYDTAGTASGLALSGTTLYVADGSSGLLLLSLANPAAPTLVASKPLVGHLLTDVAVNGTSAWVADSTWLLLGYDVSVPSTPVLKAALSLPGPPFHLAVNGGLAAVGSTIDGKGDALLLVNVATPTAPSIVSTTLLNFVGKTDRAGIGLTSTRAYLGADTLGLAIFDVSTPTAPRRLAIGLTVGNAHGLALAGSLAFVADSPATSSVVDVTAP